VTRFAATLFDLDGTLAVRDQTGEDLYRGAFREAGVASFGSATDLWTALEGPPAPDPDDQRAELAAGFEAVAARHGRRVDADALARGFLATVDNRAVSFRPGAREALDAARAAGPVALVTNGPERRQAPKLDALDIADAFDATVFAGDMPNRKPHRDPFDRALAGLGADAAAAVHVGDSVEFDVAGAQGAGLAAAWCPTDPGADPGDVRPEFRLRSVGDLAAVLDGRV
jgi:putative hydrolase of the HAD superfamily